MAPIPPLVKNHLGPIYLEKFHEHSNPRDVHPSSGTQTLKINIITTVFIFCENDVVVTSWGAPANWTPWTWRLRRKNPVPKNGCKGESFFWKPYRPCKMRAPRHPQEHVKHHIESGPPKKAAEGEAFFGGLQRPVKGVLQGPLGSTSRAVCGRPGTAAQCDSV